MLIFDSLFLFCIFHHKSKDACHGMFSFGVNKGLTHDGILEGLLVVIEMTMPNYINKIK